MWSVPTDSIEEGHTVSQTLRGGFSWLEKVGGARAKLVLRAGRAGVKAILDVPGYAMPKETLLSKMRWGSNSPPTAVKMG